jgi:single-strand DNA-binding protein
MVTTETYKDENSDTGFSETNEWHQVVAWSYNAEKVSNYAKGTLVYVEGKLTTRKWEDKEGKTRYTTEVKADSIKMLKKVAEQTPVSDVPF